MAGYSGTALWKKLGYKHGTIAYVEGAPEAYSKMLTLPAEVAVVWARQLRGRPSFVHFFTSSKSALENKLRAFRKAIDPDGQIWVSWPKKSSGVPTDLTEDTIRDAAIPLGLVDIKVCAVDDVWSGLKLVIRKQLR